MLTLKSFGITVLGLDEKEVGEERLKRLYKSHFGCSLKVVYQVWNLLHSSTMLPTKGTPTHLYWTLSFLKMYETELNCVTRYGVHENTYRKWVKAFLLAIRSLDVVSTN